MQFMSTEARVRVEKFCANILLPLLMIWMVWEALGVDQARAQQFSLEEQVQPSSLLPVGNGGTGLSATGLTGYLHFSSGVPSIITGPTGTVTLFSAGALSPLFTTSTATSTTTPALSFTLSTAGSHQFFGNNSGSSAAPSFVQPAFTDISGVASSAQLPPASSSAFGAAKCDNTTITCSGGIFTAIGGGGSTSPGGTTGSIQYNAGSGTFGGAAITGLVFSNGSSAPAAATTAQLRTAIGPATNSALGVAQCDGTTITCSSGVLTATSAVGPGSANHYALFLTTTTIGNGSLSDISGIVTSSEPFAVVDNPGISGTINLAEGTASIGTGANIDSIYADSVTHRMTLLNNNVINGLVTATVGTPTAGDCAQFASNGLDISDTLRPCPIVGISSTIGGSSLTAGTCATDSFTLTGAATGAALTQPVPSDGTLQSPLVVVSAAATATNTVEVQVCAIATVTPATKAYRVAVINP